MPIFVRRRPNKHWSIYLTASTDVRARRREAILVGLSGIVAMIFSMAAIYRAVRFGPLTFTDLATRVLTVLILAFTQIGYWRQALSYILRERASTTTESQLPPPPERLPARGQAYAGIVLLGCTLFLAEWDLIDELRARHVAVWLWFSAAVVVAIFLARLLYGLIRLVRFAPPLMPRATDQGSSTSVSRALDDRDRENPEHGRGDQQGGSQSDG